MSPLESCTALTGNRAHLIRSTESPWTAPSMPCGSWRVLHSMNNDLAIGRFIKDQIEMRRRLLLPKSVKKTILAAEPVEIWHMSVSGDSEYAEFQL